MPQNAPAALMFRLTTTFLGMCLANENKLIAFSPEAFHTRTVVSKPLICGSALRVLRRTGRVHAYSVHNEYSYNTTTPKFFFHPRKSQRLWCTQLVGGDLVYADKALGGGELGVPENFHRESTRNRGSILIFLQPADQYDGRVTEVTRSSHCNCWFCDIPWRLIETPLRALCRDG